MSQVVSLAQIDFLQLWPLFQLCLCTNKKPIRLKWFPAGLGGTVSEVPDIQTFVFTVTGDWMLKWPNS